MDSVVWFILFIVLLIMEAATDALVSVWFAAGALAALIASLCGAELWLQGVLFAAVSVALLLALRPVVKKFLKPRIVKTNTDALIGQECYVTAPIDNLKAQGQVKLGAMEWTARSSTGQAIAADELVKVDKIEGVKVFVTPVH